MTGLTLLREYAQLGETGRYHEDRAAETRRRRDALIVQMFEQLHLHPAEIAAAVRDRSADEISDLVLQDRAGEEGAPHVL